MNALRTLLISPHVPLSVTYGSLAKGVGAVLPPLGILYLASHLKGLGYTEIEVLDANVLKWEADRVLSHVGLFRPNIVGLTATTLGFPYAVEVAQQVRQFDPTITIVLGGPHAKGAKEQIFDSDPGLFDFICYGEGEIAFQTLIDYLAKKHSEEELRGVLYLKQGKLVTAPPAITPLSLDAFGHPSEWVDPAWVPQYHEKVMAYKFRPMFALYTSRGCPFKCTFCSSPSEFSDIFNKRMRYHSIEWILEEIRILQRRFGVREIIFVDDTFNLKRSRVMDFCKALIAANLDLLWTCNFEVHITDRELLQTMKQAGCWGIMIGAESGDPQVLKDLKKGITLEELSQTAKWCNELGLASRPSFILGTPTDTRESIERTIDFASKQPFHFPYFQLYVPIPGTEMFKHLSEQGKLLIKDRKQMAAAQVNYVPNGLDFSFLASSFRKAHLRSYINFRMILRHFRLIKTWNDVYRYFLAAQSLLRMVFSPRYLKVDR